LLELLRAVGEETPMRFDPSKLDFPRLVLELEKEVALIRCDVLRDIGVSLADKRVDKSLKIGDRSC
jgi:hypothetical protein